MILSCTLGLNPIAIPIDRDAPSGLFSSLEVKILSAFLPSIAGKPPRDFRSEAKKNRGQGLRRSTPHLLVAKASAKEILTPHPSPLIAHMAPSIPYASFFHGPDS